MDTSATKGILDIYDEEFFANLEIAKGLLNLVPTQDEKDICKKYINKLVSLKSNDPVVKKNRNGFFRYMLQVLNKGIQENPEAHYGFPQYDDRFEDKDDGAEKDKDYMSRWSGDRRTYVAAKPLPGKGALVYMAVAKDPSLGWDNPCS